VSTTTAKAAETKPLALVEGAVLVPRPARERAIHELAMRCSSNRIPDPLESWTSPSSSHTKPDGWWLAEGAAFDGRAWPLNSYGELSAADTVSTTDCSAAFCTVRGRSAMTSLATQPPDSEAP